MDFQQRGEEDAPNSAMFWGAQKLLRGKGTPLANIGLTPSTTGIKARVTNIEHLILKRNVMHE